MELTTRQRRLLDAVLVLAAIALGFVVLGFLSGVLQAFGDVVLLVFLAWLLSFALRPVIDLVDRALPFLPRAGAVVAVYLAIVVLALAAVIQAAAALAGSIGQLLADAPQLRDELGRVLTVFELRLLRVGLRVELADQAPAIVDGLQAWAGSLVGPLQSAAVASIGVIGNVLLLVILSIYMAVDRAAILAFLYRLTPEGWRGPARLVQVSVARSFAAFLRGQLVQGLAFGALTAAVNAVFGLEYGAVTAVLAGILHAVPFFGPFVSWAPPVVVALLLRPDVLLPVGIVMGVGWLLAMNVLQPRLMAEALGIHPILVLGSVVVGAKVAGVAGAIFGIPVAAVLAALFLAWLEASEAEAAARAGAPGPAAAVAEAEAAADATAATAAAPARRRGGAAGAEAPGGGS